MSREALNVPNVPVGSFDLRGKWGPNPLLRMSNTDQRKRMLAAGHICEHAYMPDSCPYCAEEAKAEDYAT